jgi:FdrA protein
MLAIRTLILPDTYRDSVFLMKLSVQAREESGAVQVSAMMGTPRNKALFVASGLATPESEGARPDDLVVVVQAEEKDADRALSIARGLLEAPTTRKGPVGSLASSPQTLELVCSSGQGADLALISVAGDYARYEAARALHAGLDVMLYSDNISLRDELALKKLARSKGLMVMGPDCGTAIINGVPLAFANKVRRGPVGLIGASGTGLQEVACLLDRFGVGISQAYGTGGRDLKDAVGGITTLTALERLLADGGTRFIGILGKPPEEATRKAILECIARSGKQVAVHFLGAASYVAEDALGIPHASDLTAFAVLLARLVDTATPVEAALGSRPQPPSIRSGFLRGLFSGGSLCQEAADLAAPILGQHRFSNLPLAGFGRLNASDPSRGHSFWDFGDDEFTVGRPHPMMAPELRMDRLVRELTDPEVAVVLLDLVIGYGSASGQAELVTKALQDAEEKSGGLSREKLVVASVCGTDLDSPSRTAQVEILRQGGVTVLGSNAQAAVFAAEAATGSTQRAE